MFVLRLFREQIDQAAELVVGAVGLGRKGNEQRAEEAAGEGEDRHPEVLGHRADEGVLRAEPAALEQADRLTHRQRSALEDHGPGASPRKQVLGPGFPPRSDPFELDQPLSAAHLRTPKPPEHRPRLHTPRLG